MTYLTLSAVSLNDQPLSQPITVRFDAGGGTIGRADHNTMALPDPERFISRVQAEIVCVGDEFLIRNVGAANPIDIGGRSLLQGDSSQLRDADSIRIGGYLMLARVEQDRSTVADDAMLGLERWPGPAQSQTLPRAPRSGLSDNPFADMLGSATGSTSSPFDGLFNDAPVPSGPAPARAQATLPPPAGVDARSDAFAPDLPPRPRLPDDFDVFAPAPAPPSPAEPRDPFADLGAVTPEGSIDDAFGLDRPDSGELLARFASPAPAGTQPSPVPPAERDDLPAVHGAFDPPRTERPRVSSGPLRPPDEAPAPVPEVASRTASPAPADAPRPEGVQGDPGSGALAMWQSFCEGAGVDLPLPAGSEAEQMRRVGLILRSAVEGTIRLIAVRASTRVEFGAEVTMIRPTANNPLKFSPDATSGIEQLLRAPTRGFLNGPAAMNDAMRDLVAHSVGSVAGMRAAMEGMFDRFDPEALEARLGEASLLDSLLPMNRRARLWELYRQHHAAIRDAAQEDFQSLFGQAFLAAYEQQVEKLAAQRDAST